MICQQSELLNHPNYSDYDAQLCATVIFFLKSAVWGRNCARKCGIPNLNFRNQQFKCCIPNLNCRNQQFIKLRIAHESVGFWSSSSERWSFKKKRNSTYKKKHACPQPCKPVHIGSDSSLRFEDSFSMEPKALVQSTFRCWLRFSKSFEFSISFGVLVVYWDSISGNRCWFLPSEWEALIRSECYFGIWFSDERRRTQPQQLNHFQLTFYLNFDRNSRFERFGAVHRP